MVPVSLVGVYAIGPENFLCALLHWEEKGRFVPVWLPPLEGTQLLARLNGWSPSRPTTQDLLADVITESAQGVQSVEISGYVNGTFMATVTMEDGSELDARASDALALAVILDIAVEMDESVVAQAGLWISPADAKQYFDLDIAEAEEDTAGSDPAADTAFAQLMRDLGVEESELMDSDEGEPGDLD